MKRNTEIDFDGRKLDGRHKNDAVSEPNRFVFVRDLGRIVGKYLVKLPRSDGETRECPRL